MGLKAKFSALPLDCQKPILARGGLLTHHTESNTKRVKIVTEVIGNPNGLYLPNLVKRVFGHDSTSGTQANTDYQFTKRFLTKHPAYFRMGIDQNGAKRLTGVEPTQDLLDLILQGVRQNIEESDLRDDKDFCQDLLCNTDRLSPDIQNFFSDALCRYITRTRDYSIVFELLRGEAESGYFKIPYRTRFNSRERAARSLAQYHSTLDRAAEDYDTAVMITLTTDPSKFESLAEMISALMENFNRLNSWMAYNPKTLESSRPGERLPYLKVFEFTGGSTDSRRPGLPHLHVVYFGVDRREDGMPFLIEKEELSERWDDLGQGRFVQLTPFERQSDEDGTGRFVHWTGPKDDDDSEESDELTVRRYLSKYLGQLVGLAGETGTIEEGDLSNSDLELYKLALYWVTGRQVWSCSESLRSPQDSSAEAESESGEQDTEPVDVLVRFAGCYRNGDLPKAAWTNVVEAAPLHTERLHSGAYRWRMSCDSSLETGGGGTQPVES